MIKESKNNLNELLENEYKIFKQSQLFIKSKKFSNNDLYDNYLQLAENYKQLIDKFKSFIEDSTKTYEFSENIIQNQETDLNKVIVDTIELLIHNIRKKNLVVKTNLVGEIIVKYEEKMLRTICRHLISNAVKYSYNGGLIEISTSFKNEFIEFIVKDNGTGISKENLKKIFSVDSGLKALGTAGEKGTGLGLIICKNYIEKSGGNMAVKSESGKGCRFEVLLPK